MSRQEHHVVPNPNGGWDVKRNGSDQADIHTDIKRAAIQQGRVLSRDQATEFIIHGKDGRIQRSDSHGTDPFPPRG